jgi:hypothetical protein
MRRRLPVRIESPDPLAAVRNLRDPDGKETDALWYADAGCNAEKEC